MDLLLAVGTSFSVGVTDWIGRAAAHRRVPTFIVDPGTNAVSAGLRAVHVSEKAEDLLPVVAKTLTGLVGPDGGRR